MTTAREVKRLVGPLLQRHPDLVIAKPPRLILLRPMRHVLRGIFIDATSSRNRFSPNWVIVHLYGYRRGVSVNMGGIIPRQRGFPWSLEEPDIDIELCNKAEAHALPILRSIETIPDYVRVARGGGLTQPPLAYPGDFMLTHIATGDLDAARAVCRDEMWKWPHVTDPHMRPSFDRWQQMGRLVMADDRHAMIALLHEWEEQTVANMELTEFWERTPFPIEQMA